MLYIELGVLCATRINYRTFVVVEANRLLRADLSAYPSWDWAVERRHALQLSVCR